MKSVVAPYASRAICMRIVCANGTTIRLTRYPMDLTMSNGQVYQSAASNDLSAFSSTGNLSPSSIDLEGFVGLAGITKDKIASGVFDNARAYLFACDFLAPVEDHEPLLASICGKTTLEDDKYKIEEMSLKDALNTSVGLTYTAACQRKFGDTGCGKNLAALTVTGAVTSVTSAYIVRDSSRTEPADYFAGGALTWTSGPNVGLAPMEIKRHEADGTIETYEPSYYAPQVGNTFSLTPGCRKRRSEDCRDKWSNVINFLGFADMPTTTEYTQIGGNQ